MSRQAGRQAGGGGAAAAAASYKMADILTVNRGHIILSHSQPGSSRAKC